MGRHGTGGSEDGREQGNDESNDSVSAFWGPDEHLPEEPGWPALPDQVEVTGQWAPMPRRDDPVAQQPQSDPLETTGAFAPPPRAGTGPDAGQPFGAPPRADAGQPFGAPPRGPAPDAEQPFETTGAFARPPHWDAPEATQHLDSVGPASDPFARPGAFGQHPDQGAGAFGSPPDGTQAFEQRPDATQAFGTRPGGSDPFGTRPGDSDPFGTRPGGDFEDRWPGRPPEPGDVKVAGEPTVIDGTAPAWADSDRFLGGAEWSADDEDDKPRRRGRRKAARDHDVLDAPSGGGGKGKVALLSVAAVAVVLGGTVAGVKLMGSSSTAAEKCSGATCAAVQASNQPGPQSSQSDTPTEEDSETPTEEPTEEESTPAKENTPSPTATVAARTPRRTTSPSPTPTRSKTKTSSPKPTRAPVEPTPEDSISATPTDEPSVLHDGGVVPTDGTTAPDSSAAPGAGSVNIDYQAKQRLAGYTAHLDVVNSSPRTLGALTVSLPVTGKVLDVSGATWTQDGDLLIIDLAAPLASGASAEVTFTAVGKATQPESCGMVGGDCAVK
ncbi:hypothetical protein ABT294_24025 [Nonomuraea sp. NPDC000554]|uniref:hypothetical protein n=1 Tax=Nonomuraea sp. NPDC000554 TaxID=3154259 RepID=UPI003316D009